MFIKKIKSTFAQISQLAQVPGNRAPVVRLCLVAAIIVGGLLLTICTLPSITDGIGAFLYAILTGITISILAAGIVWGFAVWAAFIFPKSRAVANRVWENLFAWNLIGLAIKVMIWIYLVLMPVTVYGAILTPMIFVVLALSKIESELLGTLILVLLVVSATGFVVLLDVCKLKGLRWTQVLRALFGNTGKTAVSKEN